MNESEYRVINNKKEIQFEVIVNGEKATLTYRFYKKDISLIHTSVPGTMAGKGIATALAKAAFSYAKNQSKPVMVYCPFVAGFLKKHNEYIRLLDKQYLN